MNAIKLIQTLLSGRKQYLTAAMLIILGVGVFTGNIDPTAATELASQGPVTFENIDEALKLAAQGSGEGGGSNDALGLFMMLFGANSAANRAAIKKSGPAS